MFSFFDQFCHFGEAILSLFLDLGFVSVVKGGPDPKKVRKNRKTQNMEARKDTIFCKHRICSLCFFVVFWRSLRECFFCGLVATVSQTGTTLGHFCSHIT